MQNHEYGLAIPLARLYGQALQRPEGACRPVGTDEPPRCALAAVEALVCPCIRGNACVCRALAREFAARVITNQRETHREDASQ